MTKLLTASAAVLATYAAMPAMACSGLACTPPPVVPEISALEGTAAIAAVVAIVALVWERRRRAA